MIEEIKLKSPALATKDFAAQLTAKTRELDELERSYQITSEQATDILNGMIESFVWAVVQTLRRQDKVNDLANLSLDAKRMSLKSAPSKARK